jgi:enterochelin esterase-like enzyme
MMFRYAGVVHVTLILMMWGNLLDAMAGGTLVVDGFVSDLVPRSPNNPDPSDNRRLFTAYLPPNYQASNTAIRYPVVYLFPGLGGDYTSFTTETLAVLDAEIPAELIVPMIVIHVDPSLVDGIDAQGKYQYMGSWFVNSALNGQFEDYIITQLVPYVDANYNTINSAAFRAVMGQSMGGYGATYLGMKHSDTFVAFASASGTPFWIYVTDLATPGDPLFYINSAIQNELNLTGTMTLATSSIAPGNGTLTYSFFSYAAAFSPSPSGTTGNSFLDTFFVHLPFQVNANGTPVTSPGPVYGVDFETTPGQPLTFADSLVLDPTVLNQWAAFNPYTLVDTYQATLAQQGIYLDAGTTEPANNVGARFLSQELAAQGIDHEYFLYAGDHDACLNVGQLPCSRWITMMQLFSAVFAQAGVYPDTVRVKIFGTGSITLTGNAQWNIDSPQMVGIETSPSMGVTATDITITINDSASLAIGNHTTVGGALQIGNRFSKAKIEGDPALANNTVNATILVDGPHALLQIGQFGFLGLGMGRDGAGPWSNQSSISTLTNLQNITLSVQQGLFIHDMIDPGNALDASIFGIGTSASYTLSCNPYEGNIRGGGNMVLALDSWQHLPTVQTEATQQLPGGVLEDLVTSQTVIDLYYGLPISSPNFYTDVWTVGVFASSEQLDNRGLLNSFSLTTTSGTALFNFFNTTNYDGQAVKESALGINATGRSLLYFDANVINRINNGSIPIRPSQTLDLNTVAQKSGVVGLWLEGIPKQIVLVYDTDPDSILVS